ncbi:MAG: prepilin-type N-terminal cleavage/methylation domain-containing protein, partial [Dehalococcoidia bacterium]|nr:prepilin-type N-terminal cleavage/methylation domain-containing protein [Dehalococcoidia bacterium]
MASNWRQYAGLRPRAESESVRREAGRQAEGLGFTLIELLVVLSILAVLAAVVIPMVTGVSTTARVT